MSGLPFRDPEGFAWGPGPSLPNIERGEMFWSETVILRHEPYVPDRKPERPVVVVRPPTNGYPRVHVIVRTSSSHHTVGPSDVEHPAQPQQGLDRDGWFIPPVKWAPHHQFVQPGVRPIGPLGEPYLGQVLDRVRDTQQP